MLDRFDIGKLIACEKTQKGVMGQTMFVRSSSGEYVLKGNPLYEGQFIEEKFFVENLFQRTKIPVPSPFLIDESDTIFGWSYSLMPRLPGSHMNNPEFQALLSKDDKRQITALLAKTLLELHSWKVEQYGEFDPVNQTLRPFNGTYKAWLYTTIKYWMEDAKKYSEITAKDTEWVENLLANSADVFDRMNSPTFVMGDYKPENILLESNSNEWVISGLFDFTNSYFGDGVADLPRLTAMFLENGEEELAREFLTVYLNNANIRDTFIERFRVHMLHQRVLDWGCAKAINNVTWDKDLSFSCWAERFTESAAYLLK
jgi:aminoglycoside phosphotransferase (APT) family kinase protein